jgi:hypothetical protein
MGVEVFSQEMWLQVAIILGGLVVALLIYGFGCVHADAMEREKRGMAYHPRHYADAYSPLQMPPEPPPYEYRRNSPTYLHPPDLTSREPIFIEYRWTTPHDIDWKCS